METRSSYAIAQGQDRLAASATRVDCEFIHDQKREA